MISATASTSSSSRVKGPVVPVAAARTRVAYMMSRFPKLTETFVLFEILAVEQQGIQVDVYPLLGADNGAATRDGATIWQKFRDYVRPNQLGIMHPEAEPLVRRAHYLPFFSWSILCAQIYFLLRQPIQYFRCLGHLIRGAWGNWNFLIGGLVAFPKTVAFARQMQIDHIEHLHAHFANHPALAAYVIHQLTGIPYSFTAHGSDLHRDKRLLREKVASAAFVVTISNYNHRVIVEHCGADAGAKTIVVHCGVDTQQFASKEMADDLPDATHDNAPSLPADNVTRSRCLSIICVGTLHEVKGQVHLIDACAILKSQGVAFQCQLLGDGPDREMLEERIRSAGLADQVQLLGPRTRREVIRCLREADVMVQPSVPSRSGRKEGIPVVLMEGMACELAVVASDLSGIPELVENGVAGLLVPPGDAQAIASALRSLADQPALRQRLGQSARQKVLREFDLTSNARRLATLYSQSATPASRPSPHA